MRRWAKSEPVLFCSGSKQISFSESRWRRVVPASVIAQKLPRNRRVGRVRQIHILKRNSSGWVQAVRILGTDGVITLKKENEIRNFLAMGSLRSIQFQMDTIVRDGKAQAFVFYGNGWGHGVGFCQSGAAGRAEAGQTVKEILEHYFPETQLTQKP
jgi:SpoIID/LytB domain protein